jgi:hypothetical protein
MPDIVHAPWSDEQVANLNRWQQCDHVHPFTCPNEHTEANTVALFAHRSGWMCPLCDYRQDWAHAMMTLGPPPSPFDKWRL